MKASIPIRDRLVDVALTSLVSGAIALAAAAGFSTPKSKLDDHEERIRSVESSMGAMNVTVGKMDQKIDDLVTGLGVRHLHPGAYIR